MDTSATYAEIKQLIETEDRFRLLLRRATRTYLTWDEFLTQRLPSGLSPLETWNLLGTVTRCMGIEFPVPDLAGNDYWYLRTHEIADTVSRIQCLCRADSDLYATLTTSQNRRVLVRSRIDETLAAAMLDGLEIDEAEAQVLLELERSPRTSVERLVVNTLAAFDHLDDLVNEPFSLELFMHLRALLLDGVDMAEIGHATPRLGLMTSEYTDAEVARSAARQAEYISLYANHMSGDPHDHPVIRALLLPDMFRFYRPLPDLNSQVGRLVFRLYAMKAGLPVLGVLPLSRVKLRWEDGDVSPLISLDRQAYTEAHRHSGTNLTPWATLVVQMTLAALDDTLGFIDRINRRDEELRQLLQLDPELNHRQRSILGRALRNPGAEFRIAYHKTNHRVAYATARADLLELVDKQLLEMHQQGRAFVFTPVPDLAARLGIENSNQPGLA